MATITDNIPTQVRSIRAFGSAGINLAYLAMGAVDCYFEFGFHIWDYAGPCLLVRYPDRWWWKLLSMFIMVIIVTIDIYGYKGGWRSGGWSNYWRGGRLSSQVSDMVWYNDHAQLWGGGQNTGRKSQYLSVIVLVLIIISMKLKIMMTYFIQEGSCCCVLLTCGWNPTYDHWNPDGEGLD